MKALLIERAGAETQRARPLNRVAIAGAANYDEKWLQHLLFTHPALLPLEGVDAGAGGLIPVCRELPIPKEGATVFLDMLGVTPQGRLVLVECKLWRNPQARREVVGQILEYASLLRRWRYADLMVRLKPLLKIDVPNPLYELVRRVHPAIGEATFVDAVSRSLTAGEFDLIVAGDGIRSDLQAIGEHLNSYAGLASRLMLAEIQVWTDGEGNTLVAPLVPFRTEVLYHRVVVDAGGIPVTLAATMEESPSPVVASVERDGQHDSNRAFWQTFIEAARFDHADQTPPRHGGNNWVRLSFPSPINTATIYRSKSGAGVFFRLKGSAARDLFETLRGEQEVLRDEIDRSLTFAVEAEEPFAGLVEVAAPLADNEAELSRRLVDLANRFASAFRLRLAGAAQPKADNTGSAYS